MVESTKDTPKTRPTPTIEDYLAIMFVLEREAEAIIAARLAESLEVAPPTVAVTLKRMERDGWITIEGRKHIYLTDSGRDAARSVIRRHMLTEWMLARMLKVPWSRIHEEAHNIEHTISDDIENRLRSSLDDPQLCPHGNPLPGFEHITADWVPLTEFAPGDRVIIRRIHEIAEDDLELLDYLQTNEIIPGRKVTIGETLSFNQTLSLIVEDKKVVLGFITAQFIFAEKSNEA
jgi:DtxR family Mn-dependent transcriptional regulator